MLADLVATTTADQMRLDGAWLDPQAANASVALDVVLMLHGVGGNFYRSNLFENLTPRLRAAGLAALWVNTRGRDGFYLAPGAARRRQGAAFEIVEECRLDVDAWLALARQRGARRVAVLGHSLGALKAIYAAAHGLPEEARCVLALSPPLLSRAAFVAGEQSDRYAETLARAEAEVAARRPETVLEVAYPVPMLISAGTYVDKYGGHERYNLLDHVPRVTLPLCCAFGEHELTHGGAAFVGVPAKLRSRARPENDLEIVEVPRANHNYDGVVDLLAAALLNWLRRRFPA